MEYTEGVDFSVYDNAFSNEFIKELNKICNTIPNVPGNIVKGPNGESDNSPHNLLGSTLYERYSKYVFKSSCPIELLQAFQHIADNVIKKDLDLWRIDSNLQTKSMDGTVHTDTGDTVLFFTTDKWEKGWGGEFQLFNSSSNRLLKTFEYVPGRVIYFKGRIPHRGLAPIVPYVYRHSIAYRVSHENYNINHQIESTKY
jgi:hypothetical protein